MPASVHIRQADASDLSVITALIRSCVIHMERHGIHQWDEVYPDRTTIANDIERRELYILEHDGSVAGVVTLNEQQESEYRKVRWQFSGKAMVVHSLAVAPAFQGQGCGRELMRFAHGYARGQNYTTIRLDAFSSNPRAVALYERLGYRRAGSVRFRKGEFYCFEIRVEQG